MNYQDKYISRAVELLNAATDHGSEAYTLYDDCSLVLFIRYDVLTGRRFAGLYSYDVENGQYVLKNREYMIHHEF